MDGPRVLLLEEHVLVFLDHEGHLVVTDGMQFIVGNRSRARLEFIELHGLVTVGEFLYGQRVGRIVYQNFRVRTDIDEVDGVGFHIRVVGANGIVPADAFRGCPEGFDKFARPCFGIDTRGQHARRHEAAAQRRGRRHAVHGRDARNGVKVEYAGNGGSDCGIDTERCEHAQKGKKEFSHSEKGNV